MALNVSIVVGGIALLLAVYLIRGNSGQRRQDAKLLPGPKGLPLIGNLHQLPPFYSWLKFKEWSDQYGPIFRINLVDENHVILSTEKVANDLLRDKGNIYSSRAYLPATDLLGRNLRPVLLPHEAKSDWTVRKVMLLLIDTTERYKRVRRLWYQFTITTEIPKQERTIALESTYMLKSLINSPADYENCLNRYASGVVFRLAFGKKVEEKDDPYLPRIVKVVRELERIAAPGAYLADTFPILMSCRVLWRRSNGNWLECTPRR